MCLYGDYFRFEIQDEVVQTQTSWGHYNCVRCNAFPLVTLLRCGCDRVLQLLEQSGNRCSILLLLLLHTTDTNEDESQYAACEDNPWARIQNEGTELPRRVRRNLLLWRPKNRNS